MRTNLLSICGLELVLTVLWFFHCTNLVSGAIRSLCLPTVASIFAFCRLPHPLIRPLILPRIPSSSDAWLRSVWIMMNDTQTSNVNACISILRYFSMRYNKWSTKVGLTIRSYNTNINCMFFIVFFLRY